MFKSFLKLVLIYAQIWLNFFSFKNALDYNLENFMKIKYLKKKAIWWFGLT